MIRVLSWIDFVVSGVIVALMVLLVTVISADVVARYALGGSLVYSNELSRMSFIWICFLGMPICIVKGLNVAITALESRLSEPMQRLTYRLGVVMVAILLGVVAYGAWISIEMRSVEQLNTIPVSAAWFFFPVLFGSVHSILHLIPEFMRGERAVRLAVDLL